MNILELNSYNLADAVKFNDQLNPKLWGADEHLLPEVREKLLAIADEFREFLGVNDLQLKDITISGSNAAYTYTPHSDIDLHLVVDLPEADRNEVYRELFDAKKYVFNDMHTIKIGGYDVELYVQDANKTHHSQGIYSVVNNDWVDVPKRRRTKIDDVSTRSKYEDLAQRIDTAIASDSYKQMSSLTEKIRDMRQSGLDEHGEFGPENLAFKMLRSQGKIKELYDARNAAKDQELSLKERDRHKPVFRYGFGRPNMEDLDTDGVMMTRPTNCSSESVEVEEDLDVDGVMMTRPTNCSSESAGDTESDESILTDFIDFCSKELKLEHLPTIKLRKDPQWPVVHKTFGRYINDKQLLEVAWGHRHIMDVLRTVAHELTHRHQHERDGDRMDNTAGETGSPWENEANARAGILMRDYARLHPDFFALGQAHDLVEKKDTVDEGVKSNAAAAAIVAALAGSASAQSVQGILGTIRNTGTIVQQARGITRAGLNAEVQQEIQNYVRANGGNAGAQNLSQLYQLQRQLQQQEPVQNEPLPGYTQDPDPVKESASGYIPTKRQAKDPRFSMALTKDIRPGALGLNANKLRLNTNRQGEPQQARADGVVQRMKEQLELFKKTGVAEVLDTTPGKANRAKWNNRADMVELDFVASNGIKYTLSFIPPYMGPDEFNQYTQLPDATDEVLDAGAFVDFEQTSKNPYGPGKQGIEGTGSAAEVFGIVYNAVLQYVKKHQPTYLFFQAAELNRRSLYTVLIRKMLPALPGWKFKQAGGEFVVYNTKYFKKNKLAEAEELDEVKMSPTALKKFAASPAAKGILVGFEAELIFPDVRTEDEDPEYEPDYDMDTRPSSIQEVIEFFSNDEWGYGLSERQQERLQDNLDEAYMEWYDEQMIQDFKQEADDLIKKVMIDEKDWVQENEVRKQLDMMDITGADQEAVLAAGSQAPGFKSSAEQQAYMEEHPEYEKYIEALGEAEGLLDELVQDSVRAQDKYWDQAIDDFRDHYQLDDDSGFFGDVGLRYMSDVSERFDLGWPYMTSSNDGEGNIDIEDVAASLKDVVQMPVTASGGYHQATRKPGVWIVEPDGSLNPSSDEDGGLEIISPPMPIEQAMQKLQAVIDWAQTRGCYTNSSTGLHMGVSLPGQKSFAEAEGDVELAPVAEKPIDFMKLALFLGDQHVLKQFEREANSYCRSSLEKLKAKNWSPQQIATAMEKMRGNLINLAYKDLSDRSPGRDSINMKDNYVEFRGAGGDYLSKESDQGTAFLENTLLRYVQALAIAGDPNAERQEYAKKLYKLISPKGDSTLDLFSKYAAGELTTEQLKKDWAKKTLEKDDPSVVGKSNWVLIDKENGKPVPGTEFNNLTRGEAFERANEKYGDIGWGFDLEPQNTGRWEIYRDDQGQEEQLEIIDAPGKAAAVDKAYETYTGVIPFKVRPYYGTDVVKPEPSRRAKLAKKIIQPKAQPAGQQARAPNGVPMWEVYELETGHVVHKLADHDKTSADLQGQQWLKSIGAENPSLFAVRPQMEKVAGQAIDYNYEIVNLGDVNLGVVDKFYAADKQDADATFDKWLEMKGLPTDTSNYGYRPRKQDPAVQDVNMDVAQNFTQQPGQDPFERNSDRIDAIRGRTPDATQQEGTWQIIDVTVNQPVETFQGTWADADRIARQYETGPGEHNGHEISVRRAPA